MDEDGNDPMDITGNEDLYKLEELASYSAYIEAREKVMMEVDQDSTFLEHKATKNKKTDSKEAKITLSRTNGSVMKLRHMPFTWLIYTQRIALEKFTTVV